MKILAIETSCDETAAAIVENGTKILSSVVASSMELHQKTGGIIPEIAAREQIRCIIPVIQKTINNNQLTINNIDSLAVTVGPGLNGSLLVGVETAKTICWVFDKPVIPVNHIFAHIYANWLNSPKTPQFPAIAGVFSGGHTELFLMYNHDRIKWLGGTRDDAAGEAFDKTARILNLGFPGGPAIAAAAAQLPTANCQLPTNIKLPRPMINSDDLDFSFSGLKTAVMREVNKLKLRGKFNKETVRQLAYEIQEAITDVLVEKTLRAAKQYNVKNILLGGGVAANQRLKDKFQTTINKQQLTINNPQLFIPPPSFCTDNAAYIGSFAYFHNQPLPWQKINTQPDVAVEV